jgi:hypothetical protein
MTEVVRRRLVEPEVKKSKEVTFKCRFCGKAKPLDEMVVLTRYFPLIVACRDCAKKMR